MQPQREITSPCDLLDENGHLTIEGWARRPYWRYERSKIHASWFRIKEWDYYYILSHDQRYGITVTVSDLGYLGLMAVCWLDFTKQKATQYDRMIFFPKGHLNLPPHSSEGLVHYKDKLLELTFDVQGVSRIISIECPSFPDPDEKGKVAHLRGTITLQQDPTADSMVIATSWKENRKAFYYNHKVNCMPAKGEITIGNRAYEFTPQQSFAGLDWGRGRWTYKNRWYWGSASGMLNGYPFGWNIGYGFSDRTPATENMIFYQGKAHKLDEVTFHMDKTDYLQPWVFDSNDHRFIMNFKPLIDRYSGTNFGILKSIQHQVFGLFTGNVVLDSSEKLTVVNFLGFAEDVLNWW